MGRVLAESAPLTDKSACAGIRVGAVEMHGCTLFGIPAIPAGDHLAIPFVTHPHHRYHVVLNA